MLSVHKFRQLWEGHHGVSETLWGVRTTRKVEKHSRWTNTNQNKMWQLSTHIPNLIFCRNLVFLDTTKSSNTRAWFHHYALYSNEDRSYHYALSLDEDILSLCFIFGWRQNLPLCFIFGWRHILSLCFIFGWRQILSVANLNPWKQMLDAETCGVVV
jgi:hypothetical protein